MSFKNDKEYEEAKRKWQNSRWRAKSPAGYKTFQANESAYKNKKSSDSGSKNDEVKSKSKDGDGKIRESSDFSSKQYEQRDEAQRESLRGLIKKAKSKYKPQRLKVEDGKPLTSDDLPDRPKAPKAPKLELPGGVLTSERVAKPSGLGGNQNKYSTSRRSNDQLKSDYGSAPINYKKPSGTKKKPSGTKKKGTK